MRQQTDLFKKAGVVTLSVYQSTPENVKRYGPASESDTSLALSDTKGHAFKKFMLPKSLRAAVGGSFAILAQSRFRRFIKLLNALRDACWGTNMDMIRQLPGDFMINEDGVIVDLFRAEKMIDQMPFDRVEAFIPEENRCKCNKKDCIVSVAPTVFYAHSFFAVLTALYVCCRFQGAGRTTKRSGSSRRP